MTDRLTYVIEIGAGAFHAGRFAIRCVSVCLDQEVAQEQQDLPTHQCQPQCLVTVSDTAAHGEITALS